MSKIKCPFCNLDRKKDKFVFETKNFILLQSIKPVINGHCLLIPKRHYLEEVEIPLNLWREYRQCNKKAFEYFKETYQRLPLVFINAVQDLSVNHLHKHFIPGIFGKYGVEQALRNFIGRKQFRQSPVGRRSI